MGIKQLVVVLLYLGLLGCALAFCWKNVMDFLAGHTYYVSTNHKLSLRDLPSITVCLTYSSPDFGLRGQSVKIYSRIQEVDKKYGESQIQKKESVLLEENKIVKTMFNLDLHLMKMFRESKPDEYCLRIKSNWNGDKEINIGSVLFDLAFEFENFSVDPSLVGFDVWISSEDNSYGMGKERWFDGAIEKITPEFDDGIWIDHVIEYEKMEGTCSKESYYQCLGKRFQGESKEIMDEITENDPSCQFKDPCTPYQLPFENSVMPICSTFTESVCSSRVLDNLLSDQENYCLPSCNVEEFKIGKIRYKSVGSSDYQFGFGYRFGQPQSGDRRSSTPIKTVKKEYLVITWISVVGTVGGTLGMFVGFSILGSLEWLMPFGNKIANALNPRRVWKSQQPKKRNK